MIIKNNNSTESCKWSEVNEVSHAGLRPIDTDNPINYYLMWYLRDYCIYNLRGEWFYDI